MLRSRRVLLEEEIAKLKLACGALYKKLMLNQAEPNEHKMYEGMRSQLADMMADLDIINHMIENGHE